jgi:Ca-activated chloride channel family protein
VVLIAAASPVESQDKKQAEQRNKGETLRLYSDLVVVNVTVTDAAGQYVHGLTSSSFHILEDGAPQSIDSFLAEEAPFAAAILVDMSGSMEYKFGLVRGAAASFIEQIRDNDQVAVYGFNDKVRLYQDFTNARFMTDSIWDAEARDVTRLYDCLDEAIEALAKRPERRRAVVAISDGWDSASQKATFDGILKKSHLAGVTIYSIDLVDDQLLAGGSSSAAGLRRGRGELQQLATQTGGRYVHSPAGDKLEEAFINIIDELRNQYTLTYYPTNDKRDGRWRKLSLTVSRPEVTARARRGYFAPKR